MFEFQLQPIGGFEIPRYGGFPIMFRLPVQKDTSGLYACVLYENTASVLNLRTAKTDMVSCFLPHLCHARFVMSVVLLSVRVAASKS